MNQIVELRIEDHLLSQLEKKARVENVDVQVLAQRAIQNYVLDEAEQKMQQEIAAYHQMHPALLLKYKGAQVAIHQGQLVDFDSDLLSLFLRIRERYPDEVVLIRQVYDEPEKVYVVRSPRLERG